MKKKRYTEEQIIGFLREADAGVPVKELCRKHGFSEASYYLWRSKFGGMEVSDARRLKALEAEMLRPEADISCIADDPVSPHIEVGVDFGFADRDAKFFDVSPSDEVKLVVPIQPAERFKSARCRIELTLKDGTTVGPIEFTP